MKGRRDGIGNNRVNGRGFSGAFTSTQTLALPVVVRIIIVNILIYRDDIIVH